MKKIYITLHGLLIVTVLILTGTLLYAWFSNNNRAHINDMFGSIDSAKGIEVISFEAFDKDYAEINNDILQKPFTNNSYPINDLLPGEFFYTSISFKTVKDSIDKVNIVLDDIKADALLNSLGNPYINGDTYFNMTDVFKIQVDSFWSLNNDNYERIEIDTLIQTGNLNSNVKDDIYFTGSKIQSNNKVLISRQNLVTYFNPVKNQEIIITFKFTFDFGLLSKKENASNISIESISDKFIDFGSFMIYG